MVAVVNHHPDLDFEPFEPQRPPRPTAQQRRAQYLRDQADAARLVRRARLGRSLLILGIILNALIVIPTFVAGIVLHQIVPVIVVLVLSSAFWWVATRLWARSTSGEPTPRR